MTFECFTIERMWRMLITLALLSLVLGCEHGADPAPAGIIAKADETSTPQQAADAKPWKGDAVDSSTITDKVIVGYQAWFTAAGDGTPVNKWSHWANGTPSPGHLTVEMFPDTREYPAHSLYGTGFRGMGNGTPAKLYSGASADVIRMHFRWMAEYGIDGAALQRFGSSFSSPANKQNRDEIASKVRSAAEAYGRVFYIMYDTADMKEETFVQQIMDDWTNTMTGRLKVTQSPQYAKHNGKPVVNIYGLGYDHRPGTATQSLALIQWFKSQGCYVIGGVPTYWRDGKSSVKTGFEDVFKSFDMVMPWTVGRFPKLNNVDTYSDQYLVPDKQYLEGLGIAYQPVMHPGFAWSNKKPGSPQNSTPRLRGELLWKQAYNIRKANIPGAYIAMFDEYDEGTAIAKTAEDSSMIPDDQYFLTLSADGTYLSSDYYLRLAGEATKMIKGKAPLSPAIPIPYSNGPVFFRTGLEAKTDAQLSWVNKVDESSGGMSRVTGYGGTGEPGLTAREGVAHRGKYALHYAGRGTSGGNSHVYFKAFEVRIPVSEQTKLGYWMNPVTEAGRYVSVDLLMTDGTTLHESGAVDLNGNSMKASTPKGKLNSWTLIQSNIGQWLKGKTIQTILIGYELPSSAADEDFAGYVDDIIVTTGEIE